MSVAITPPPVLVEGGHYTLCPAGDGERVDVPGFGTWVANATDTTRRCFALACDEVRALRTAGARASVGLMIGDLALPPERRPPAGSWALPPSYSGLLADHGLAVDDVRIWGEAYARNQGKRRLLDAARGLGRPGRETYLSSGWALFYDEGVTRLASDAALDWDGELRSAALARGTAPLCPLVFAGSKRAIFQAGFGTHVAIYAYADDAYIDVKLRAGAAAVAQLWRHPVGAQIDRLVVGATVTTSAWPRDELVAPGESDWPAFLAAVRSIHRHAIPLEEACPTPAAPPPSCPPGKTNSHCSG